MYVNFQQNWVSRSVETVHTNLFAKICNLQLEFRNITPFGHALPQPSRTFRPILRSIGLLNNELPRKNIIYTDGRTDGQTSRTTTICSFFRKKKKLLKMIIVLPA